MKPLLSCAIVAAGLAAVALLAGCRPVTPPTPAQQATIVNPEDAVTVATSAGVTVIDVVSPRGIGAAQVWLTPAQANGSVQVHFHLQGLEQATFDNGIVRLTLSISSHPPYAVSQTLTSNGTTRALDARDEFWATVTLAPNAATSLALPLTAEAFVITLPARLTHDSTTALSLSWIDFYRQ